MPQQNVIHIDQALTNLSLAYINEEYVAEDVAPRVPVPVRSDKYFVYGKEHLRIKESRLRPGDAADEFEYTLSLQNYLAERRAQRHLVTDDEVEMSDDPLIPQADATDALAERIKLMFENDVASILTNNANITAYTALAGGNQWSDYANSTPLVNIKTGRTSVRNNGLKRANSILIPYETALNLADHPSIKDLIKYTDPNALTESGLPPSLRGLRVIEAGAIADTSVEGRTYSPTAVWGKNVIIFYRAPGSVGRKTLTLALTFSAPDATTRAQGLNTRTYRQEDRTGLFVETADTYDIRVVAPTCGYLFQTVIA